MQDLNGGGNLEYGSGGNSSFPQVPPDTQAETNKSTLKKVSKNLNTTR